VNIVDTITSIAPFDWLVVGFIVVMLILGYAQGVIRRLLGIASIAFSLLLAANLRDSFGSFLASNWVQWPREYSFMLGFGFLFAVSSVVFAIAVQSFYRHAPIVSGKPVLDEILGGLLGVLQALVIVGAGILILDSFYRLPNVVVGDNQLQFLKDLSAAVNASGTARVFRESLIPPLVAIVGPLLPSDIRSLFSIL
jgi:uncharacterized membrane protein required for colicin V production